MADPTIRAGALRDRAIQLYDAYTHDHRDRRVLLRQMIALAGSAAAAEALILGIAASPAAAAMTDPADSRLVTARDTHMLAGKSLTTYAAWPRRGKAVRGLVLVIHENRGLTPHIQDVTRRVALEGFIAVAPDLLSAQGGTPTDEDKARALIASADYDLLLAQTIALIDKAVARHGDRIRIGAVGFCWGGAFVDRLAIAAGTKLAAGVSYYGPAPVPSEAAKVKAAMLLHYAGKDARVNATGLPWAEALKQAGVAVEAFTYPNVDHAFNNDTSAERYDADAAKRAWSRTAAFLHRHLDR